MYVTQRSVKEAQASIEADSVALILQIALVPEGEPARRGDRSPYGEVVNIPLAQLIADCDFAVEHAAQTSRLGGRGRSALTTCHIELEGPVSSPKLNPTTPIDLEQLLKFLLPKINDVVCWFYQKNKDRISGEELDDLLQQINLMLIDDNCRHLRSFNGQYSFETWLQPVVDSHINNYLNSRKQTGSLDTPPTGTQSPLVSQIAPQPLLDPRVRKVMTLITGAPARKWTLGELATDVKLSPRQLERLFKAELAQSPMQYLRRYRLEVARKMLEGSFDRVKDIAICTGYNPQNHHFERDFKEQYGFSPTEYRRRFHSFHQSSSL